MSHNQGEKNGRCCKLTRRKVMRLRAKAAGARERNDGALPYGWISKHARAYNVSPGAVHDVLSGRRWASAGGLS